MDEAEFFLTAEHLEQRRRGENGQKLQEVLPAKQGLALRCERQDTVIAPENPGRQKILHEVRNLGRVHFGECWDITYPLKPPVLADAAFLKYQSHQLMRQNVK